MADFTPPFSFLYTTLIPFFPFKLKAEGDSWITHNPVTLGLYELNKTCCHLVKLCDGNRSLNEIVTELSRRYQITEEEVARVSQPILEELTKDGLLWWRNQLMQKFEAPPPSAVLWNLTNACNLHCSHCVVKSGTKSSKELTLIECLRLIDEMAAFGVQELILSGGEPLIHPHFLEITEYAAKKRLSLHVATNATLITEKLAERLAAIGVNAQVSLDGASPETHDVFRQQPGSWQRTVIGIRKLVSAKVPVMVASVVTKINIRQIPDLYKLAKDLGAHTYRILPFVPFGRGGAHYELEVSPHEMKEVTAYLSTQSKKGLPVAPMEFECTFSAPPLGKVDPQTRIGCDGSVAYCTISSCGDVLPCSFFEGVKAENVRDHSFSWIWRNSHFLNYFRSLRTTDIHGACRTCPWLSTCRGSCIATNFAHGDIFQSNCHCWLANNTEKNVASSARKHTSH
jgi:radical SAM protein with 4Fe4S-binding SPASM domain